MPPFPSPSSQYMSVNLTAIGAKRAMTRDTLIQAWKAANQAREQSGAVRGQSRGSSDGFLRSSTGPDTQQLRLAQLGPSRAPRPAPSSLAPPAQRLTRSRRRAS
jgi:hypothetical protein